MKVQSYSDGKKLFPSSVSMCVDASLAVIFNRTIEHSFSLFAFKMKERDEDGFKR